MNYLDEIITKGDQYEIHQGIKLFDGHAVGSRDLWRQGAQHIEQNVQRHDIHCIALAIVAKGAIGRAIVNAIVPVL